MSAAGMATDCISWEAMLARYPEVFTPLEPGASLAIIARRETELRPGTMLVCERREPGLMTAELRPFTGYKGCWVDVLMVAEDAGLAAIQREMAGQPLAAMKTALRCGDLHLFVMKRRDDLIDAGWEEFLDAFGLACLGTCR